MIGRSDIQICFCNLFQLMNRILFFLKTIFIYRVINIVAKFLFPQRLHFSDQTAWRLALFTSSVLRWFLPVFATNSVVRTFHLYIILRPRYHALLNLDSLINLFNKIHVHERSVIPDCNVKYMSGHTFFASSL